MFSPYVVVGTEPINPEIIVEKLSARGTVQTRIFQRSRPTILLDYDLMSDMFRGDNKDNRQNDHDCFPFEFWRGEVRKRKNDAEATLLKSTIPHKRAAIYPATIAIRIGITAKICGTIQIQGQRLKV